MFDKNNVKVGIVPNSWSNDDLPELGGQTPYEQCIDEMSLAGYAGSEMGSKYPRDPGVLKEALDLRGMQLSGGWFSTYFTVKGGEQQTLNDFIPFMNFLKSMGTQDIYVAECGYCVHLQPIPVLLNKPIFDDQQWSAMVAGLEKIGQIAVENGMRVNYHHHVGTGVQTQQEVERLMDATSPELLWLLLDTAHITYGDGDALALTDSYGDRLCHIHLKNIRENALEQVKAEGLSFWASIKAGIFTVPGDPEGMIDFKPILKVLSDRGFSGWMVIEAEQDPAKANPLKYAKMARQYITEQTGL